MQTVIEVVQHLCPGSVESMALDLATFHGADERVIIISLEGDKASAIAAWPRLKPYSDQLYFLNKKPGLKPKLTRELYRLFKHWNADVVHTHHIGPLLYAGIAARLARVEHLIYTEHDAWQLRCRRRLLLQKYLFRLLRPQLIADAESVAAQMQWRLGFHKVSVIHNGIDTRHFVPGDKDKARQQLGLPLLANMVGCSSQLEPVKDQYTLIRAIALLPEKTQLALAGTGSDEPRLRALVEKLKMENRVHFLGQVDDMPRFYQALDVFCRPSRCEGYPLSPLEAQACGIPTLVTTVGDAHVTLCPETGKTVKSGDPQAMATLLGEMLTSNTPAHPEKYIQQHGDVRQMANAYAQLRNKGHEVS